MCMQRQLLGIPVGGQLLMLLHCYKVGLNGRHYENRSTFFSLVPGGKEEILFSKCTFLTF